MDNSESNSQADAIKTECFNEKDSKHLSNSCSNDEKFIESAESRYFLEKIKPKADNSDSTKNFNQLLQRNLQVANKRCQKHDNSIHPNKGDNSESIVRDIDSSLDQTEKKSRKKKFANWLDEQDKSKYEKPLSKIESFHTIPKKSSKVAINKKNEKKTNNRFDGMSEEDVMKKVLPDHLAYGLDILIVGTHLLELDLINRRT